MKRRGSSPVCNPVTPFMFKWKTPLSPVMALTAWRADILAAEDGFCEKWLSMCEVVKGYLSDAVFENICENADAI